MLPKKTFVQITGAVNINKFVCLFPIITNIQNQDCVLCAGPVVLCVLCVCLGPRCLLVHVNQVFIRWSEKGFKHQDITMCKLIIVFFVRAWCALCFMCLPLFSLCACSTKKTDKKTKAGRVPLLCLKVLFSTFLQWIHMLAFLLNISFIVNID